MVLTSSRKASSPGRTTQAPFIVIPETIESQLAGQTIEVTVTAKAGGSASEQKFAAAYSTNANGNSGWQRFTATQTFQDFTFEYKVPKTEAGSDAEYNNDYIGVNPDPSGENGKLIVKSVTVDLAP